MATTNKLQMYKGEDVLLNFTIYGASSTASPLNVAGWTTLFSVKQNTNDTGTIFTQTGTVVSSTAGTLTVTIASCQTSSLTPFEYAHDLWRVDSGSFACLSIGTLELTGSPRDP